MVVVTICETDIQNYQPARDYVRETYEAMSSTQLLETLGLKAYL